MKNSVYSFWSLGLLAWLALPGGAVRGGDVAGYGVLKKKSVYQFGAAPMEMAATYAIDAFVAMSGNATVLEAALQLPNGDNMGSLTEDGPTFLSYEESFDSKPELDLAYPNGQYTLIITGVTGGEQAVAIGLTGDAYPNLPVIGGNTSLQSINPASALQLSWSAFTGGSAADFIQVRIEDLMAGEDAFATPSPWEAGSLNGTATSVTVPANTLQANSFYSLYVRFAKVTGRDTASYSGATGYAAYASETQMMIQTAAGGQSDTEAPRLISSRPTDRASEVAVNWAISFTFNEPMATTVAANAVIWSANAGGIEFAPHWTANGLTVCFNHTRDLPANTTIGWQLNASAFRDEAGNPLAGNATGTFTTGSAVAPDQCSPCLDEDTSGGAFGLTRQMRYTQAGVNPPQPAADEPGFFFAVLTTPTNNPVSAASLELPGGLKLELTNYFGRSFMHDAEYPSQEAMDTARPLGNHTLQATRLDGSKLSAQMNIPDGWPPTPQIANLAGLQNADATADVTVQWTPFTGATAHDSIQLIIQHDNTSFIAPDPCIPRPLPNTATSIVVPRGTLEPGVVYSASLSFHRLAVLDTNSLPDITCMASFSKEVTFELRTKSGGTPSGQPQFTVYHFLPNRHFLLQFTAEAGRVYSLQTSSDLQQWSTVKTLTGPASGLIEYEDALSGPPPALIYRIKSE